MTAFEMVSVIFGALGLLGGAVGFLRAVVADRRSSIAEAIAADAQADAASALAKSAEATERIAAAVEVIARRRGVPAESLLAEASSAELNALLGKREVRWAVEARTVDDSYRLRNTGSLSARDVTIDGHLERSVLQPGSALTFRPASGRASGAIEVTWRDDSGASVLRSTVALP